MADKRIPAAQFRACTTSTSTDYVLRTSVQVAGQGPGVVVRCAICGGLTVSDSERGEGVVVVVEVAAGVGDVGASGQAQGADRQVAEGGKRSWCCTGPDLRFVFAE